MWAFSSCEARASVVVALGLNCLGAWGILLDQGSNPRPLHWQAGSLPLMPPGKPQLTDSSLKNEESEKVGLKLNIQKTKIMASGPITSWEIDGERVEIVSDFIFEGSKITADGDCSHEIKRHLLLGEKL